ncbi:PREDICTED: uncharacterized protein LOC108380760 [Rhagoletis zephyria]|uniref:uncharacterized protein LOC108380760 n=1 Tax=Rhagoletis zephyria TaxID=28612 RepID=UPI00081130F0|nr:PREDICTED: uncharacterized protein LOC108380760 [Rhagoletis zephyria]
MIKQTTNTNVIDVDVLEEECSGGNKNNGNNDNNAQKTVPDNQWKTIGKGRKPKLGPEPGEPLVSMGGATSRKKKRVRENKSLAKLIGKPAEGKIYAEVLGTIRGKLQPEKTETVIRSVRKTHEGGVLIEMERCGDHSAFKENVCTAIGQLGDARIFTRHLRLEVLGMDCLTTAPEVEKTIRGELGDKMKGQLRVSLLAVNSQEQRMAVVEIDELPGRPFIEKGKLRYVINFATTIAKIARITNLAHEAYNELHGSNRRWWVHPVNITREEEGFFKTCIQQLKEKDEEHFFKATRINVSSFNLLLSLLKERMERFSNRKAVDPETRLAVTLIFLAQGCNFHVISWAYKLGISTVRKIIYETCDAIWGELQVVYLSPPNVSELKAIANKFYVKTGMPNYLGAIDGKHIRIVSPRNSGSLYYNYKKTFSIVLMAACDANYVFTYVDVGALGSQSDGGVLSRSAFGRKLLNGTLEVPCDTNLPGTSTNFPYYYVGDSAFPLKQNLMRPFPGRNLPQNNLKLALYYFKI